MAETPHRLLLKAARRLEPLDIGLRARPIWRRCPRRSSAGRLGARDGVRETARGRPGSAPSPEPPRAPDLLLDGLAPLHTEGYAAGTPMLKRALTRFRGDELSSEDGLRWLWLACRTAMDLWDDESWFVLSARQVQLAREAGALTVLPLALNLRAGIHIFAGEFAGGDADRRSGGGHRRDRKPASRLRRAVPRRLAGPRGRDGSADEAATTGRHRPRRGQGDRRRSTRPRCSTTALPSTRRRWPPPGRPPSTRRIWRSATWGLVELIEAAARCGEPELAADGLRRLSELTAASGTDWALGVEALPERW